MPKKNEMLEENVPHADRVNTDSTESDPNAALIQQLVEQNQRMTDQLSMMGDRLARAEFAGADKNKQRQWDEQNGTDVNVKYGHLPSFDGITPIIDRKLEGAVSMDVYGNPVDKQVYVFTLPDGSVTKLAMNDYVSALSGTPIYARCNNWLDYVERCKVIDNKRHQFQVQGTRFNRSNLDTVALMREIKELENNNTMNVTLSLDVGKSYTGETFDVKAYMWNC